MRPVSAEASAGSSGAAALLDPNPLFVELKPNAPTKPPPQKKKRKRPIQTAAPAADAPPARTALARRRLHADPRADPVTRGESLLGLRSVKRT